MSITVFGVFCSLIYLAIVGGIIRSALRRSSFGVLLVIAEYFYFIGYALFPLALFVGFTKPIMAMEIYEDNYGQLQWVTYLHVLCYCLGALVGYFMFPWKQSLGNALFHMQGKFRFNKKTAFSGLMFLALAFSVLYIALVGIDFALKSVIEARDGRFDSFGDNVRYVFLNKLAECGLLGIVFVPGLVRREEFTLFRFGLLIFAVVMVFANNAARVMFVDKVLLTALLLAYGRKFSIKQMASFILLALMLAFIYQYGKTVSSSLAAYMEGDELTFVSHFSQYSGVDAFFNHFGHVLFSIDAGIRHFTMHGPLFTKDILLAPIGVVPSSWFDAVGLQSVCYYNVEEKLLDVNTKYFVESLYGNIPPYYVGVAAYLLPGVGGFLFGVIRFSIYSSIEAGWSRSESVGVSPWLCFFVFIIANDFMLFIPTSIALASFEFIFVVCILALVRMLQGKSDEPARK